jgi:hypothetical protein
LKCNIQFWSLIAKFLKWEMLQTKVVTTIDIHIWCSITCFRKMYRLWDNVGIYCTAVQATDGNTAHVHFMTDSQGYKHTLRIRTTCCFWNATTVARTCLTLHIQYIAWLVMFINNIEKIIFMNAEGTFIHVPLMNSIDVKKVNWNILSLIDFKTGPSAKVNEIKKTGVDVKANRTIRTIPTARYTSSLCTNCCSHLLHALARHRAVFWSSFRTF